MYIWVLDMYIYVYMCVYSPASLDFARLVRSVLFCIFDSLFLFWVTLHLTAVAFLACKLTRFSSVALLFHDFYFLYSSRLLAYNNSSAIIYIYICILF